MKNDPHTPKNEDDLPVIHIDDDLDNANWIRILERRRKEQQPPEKEHPSNGRQPQ